MCHWLTLYALTLNASKTKYMTFSIRNDRTSDSTYHDIVAYLYFNSSDSVFLCLPIENTKSIKCLGVTLNRNLLFDEQQTLLQKFKTLTLIGDPQLIKHTCDATSICDYLL